MIARPTFSSPRGIEETPPPREKPLGINCNGCQSRSYAVRIDSVAKPAARRKDSKTRRLPTSCSSLTSAVERRIGRHRVGEPPHDHARRLCRRAPGACPSQVFPAQLVIGIEDADLCVGLRAQNVLCVGLPLGQIAGVETHGPRKMRRVVECRRACLHKKLRNFAFVEIAANRQVRLRAQRAEDQPALLRLPPACALIQATSPASNHYPGSRNRSCGRSRRPDR